MNSDTEKPHPNLNKPTDNLESVPSQKKANAWIDPVDRIAQAAQALKQEEEAYTDSLTRSESPEPQLGSASFSPGLIVLGLICMFLGGFYLERRSADYRSDVYSQASDLEVSVHTKEGPATSVVDAGEGDTGTPVGPSVDVDALIAQGKTVYETYCLACHQANGEGLPAAFPALAGSEWVLEEGPGRIIRAVLQGLQGPIEVKGQAFNSVMVAWRAQLSDDDVASVLTYIRQEWGNDAGYVTPDQVASVWSSVSGRGEEAWTADELLALDPAVETAGASGGAGAGADSGSAASEAIDPARIAAGEQVYLTMCLACHQQTGQGLAGLFPPLAGSEWVTTNQPDRIIRIVLNGLQGEISVQGQTYNNVMTPWKDMLDDQQVADVLTYIRNSWDNTGSGVSASKVKEIRSATADRDTPWTAAELEAIPVD